MFNQITQTNPSMDKRLSVLSTATVKLRVLRNRPVTYQDCWHTDVSG